jgi:hypothetical protein
VRNRLRQLWKLRIESLHGPALVCRWPKTVKGLSYSVKQRGIMNTRIDLSDRWLTWCGRPDCLPIGLVLSRAWVRLYPAMLAQDRPYVLT